MTALTSLPVDEIRIGHRYRQELGDLSGLIASIERRGLLHPIVIRPTRDLIAGYRRLLAWKQSSRRREPIPVHVVDIDSIVAGQHDENFLRKEFTCSERVSLMEDLVPAIAVAARERQAHLGRTHGDDPSGQFARKGETRALVATVLGTSPRSLAKMSAIVVAAKREPEKYGKLQVAMDRTGKVDGPHKRLRVMMMADEIRREPPPLPGRGPYRVIVADPPWPFDKDATDPSERGTHPYPQMSYAQIRALDVRSIAHEDAALWLWTTNHHLPEAFSVLATWGFEPRTMLTWVKNLIGRGHYLREQTEHCLVAIRGRPTFVLNNESTVLQADRLEHSRKPDAFYAVVERVCPAPLYTALFSHNLQRQGWDTHSTEKLDGAPAPVEPSDTSLEEVA